MVIGAVNCKGEISWNICNYLAPGGGCEVLFSPGLCVCLSVCLSVCVSVCPANILVFYFSAIRRDIDLKLYRILTWLYSIH